MLLEVKKLVADATFDLPKLFMLLFMLLFTAYSTCSVFTPDRIAKK
jgi:hypothetical protein|tara:strand:- start:2108 stop:2245 length:138 start_codon:yes stop_codon:yes gene_type:complete